MKASNQTSIDIRPAVAEDVAAIARTFVESAEHHARIDPQRYAVPEVESVSAQYRRKLQHHEKGRSITLVAEWGAEVIAFVDAGLEESSDPMHREMIYCHLEEIAVR